MSTAVSPIWLRNACPCLVSPPTVMDPRLTAAENLDGLLTVTFMLLMTSASLSEETIFSVMFSPLALLTDS